MSAPKQAKPIFSDPPPPLATVGEAIEFLLDLTFHAPHELSDAMRARVEEVKLRQLHLRRQLEQAALKLPPEDADLALDLAWGPDRLSPEDRERAKELIAAAKDLPQGVDDEARRELWAQQLAEELTRRGTTRVLGYPVRTGTMVLNLWYSRPWRTSGRTSAPLPAKFLSGASGPYGIREVAETLIAFEAATC